MSRRPTAGYIGPSTGAGALILFAALAAPWAARAQADAPGPAAIDCATDPRALHRAVPRVQHQDGDEIHQVWHLVARPDLWSADAPELPALESYREKARAELGDTTPLAMIRANRERNPWLERDHPAEAAINRLVEAGVGVHRPISCLESHLLAYQAARFPLYEQPTEIIAAVLRGPPGDGTVKVYVAADGDANPPRPTYALQAIETDVVAGWRFATVFHNHTFHHSPERGLIPVAAPSASDVQLSVALSERLGLEEITVTDGFSTLVLDGAQMQRLWEAVNEARASDPDGP